MGHPGYGADGEAKRDDAHRLRAGATGGLGKRRHPESYPIRIAEGFRVEFFGGGEAKRDVAHRLRACVTGADRGGVAQRIHLR